MRLKFLTGDVNWKKYGGQFVTKKLSNGEFDYWLVADFMNFHDATGAYDNDKYVVIISVVSPQEAGKENIKEAKESYGLEDEKIGDLFLVEILHSYGIKSNVWQCTGNNADKLMKKARKELSNINMLFGFYMDRPQNMLGSTGWDFIKGDITAGLK